MMSDSFMMRRSSPSILTSVPDHLPNSTLSPAFTPMGVSLPSSPRAPGPAETTLPVCGFSAAVSGMMIPPVVFSSSSIRLTTTRSCKGLNFMDCRSYFLELPPSSTRELRVPTKRACNGGRRGVSRRHTGAASEPAGPLDARTPLRNGLRGQAAGEGDDVGRRTDLEDRIVGRAGDAVHHITGQETEGVAGRIGSDGLDADLAERRGRAAILVVPAERRIGGLIAVLADDRGEIEGDRPLGDARLELLGVEIRSFGCRLLRGEAELAGLRDELVFRQRRFAGGVGEGEAVHAPIAHPGKARRHGMRGLSLI